MFDLLLLLSRSFLVLNLLALHALGEAVFDARLPRLSWLDSVKPDTLIVGPASAPLATAGVVADAEAGAADAGGTVAAEEIGTRPMLPPNTPAGTAVAAPAATVAELEGRLSVLRELAMLGRGASVAEVEAEATAELSDTGAPTIGRAAPDDVWAVGSAANEVDDWLVVERPGSRARPDEAVAPWLGSGARDGAAPAVVEAAPDKLVSLRFGSGASDEAGPAAEEATADWETGGAEAAGADPTRLVLRAPAGTGIVVRPTPPCAATTGSAEPAAPAGAADAETLL